MKTIFQVYPPLLLALIVFVQLAAMLVNYYQFDSRELLIYACWIPFFTLPYLFIKKKILYRIIIVVFFLEGLVNLCHLLILKVPLTASSLLVMSNTNMDEATEFMIFKFSFLMLLVIPYFILFVVALRKPIHITIQPHDKYVITIVLLFSVIFISESIINKRLIRKGIPQTAKALLSFREEMKSFEALKHRKVLSLNDVFITEKKGSQVFLLIIGESCNRKHLSLYHYFRKTSPKLESRKDIICYTDVISSHSNTIGSLLSILTESNLSNKLSYDNRVSLIDVFHSIGFKTYWISNQSPLGIWDNAIFDLAQTSALSFFVNNTANSSFESTYTSSFDEKLFHPFLTILNEKSENKFIVIHLMGSHSDYVKRYPSKYEVFNNHPSGKMIIDEYDNSVLYNDFVVDSLFNIFDSFSHKHSDALCSAIYLSDHGENVFDEHNNCGHDYSGSLPKSNVEIPFVIWLSSGYKNYFIEKTKIIEANKDLPFVSDDLFHAVMDMNGIESKYLIKTNSIFNEEFNKGRKRILEDGMDYDLK